MVGLRVKRIADVQGAHLYCDNVIDDIFQKVEAAATICLDIADRGSLNNMVK